MSEPAAVLTRAGLDELVAVLIADGYRVVGPVKRDDAIVLAELSSGADLPSGWGVDTAPGRYRLRRRGDQAVFGHSAGPQSWKQFLHPPRQQLWSAESGGFTAGGGPGARAVRVHRRARLRPGRPSQARSGAGWRRACRRRVHPPPARTVRGRGWLHRTRRGLLLRVDGHRARSQVPATISRSPSGSTRPGTGSWWTSAAEAGQRVLAGISHRGSGGAEVDEAARGRRSCGRPGWGGRCRSWTSVTCSPGAGSPLCGRRSPSGA